MTEPVPDEDGTRPPLSPQDKRARVGATAAAIGIAAVVTSIVLGIGVAALLATAGGEEDTEDLAVPASAVTTAIGSSITVVPAAPAGPSSAPAPSSAPPTTPSALGTAGQANKEAKEAPPKVEVVAGDCVSGLGEKEVTAAPCGSGESRYKVASMGPAGTACPTDADSSHTIADTTLCLDIDWVIGSCVDVSGEQPQRTECGPGGVRVISILPETNSVNACPSADRGFVYDERRFVVCFADI